jgi:acyl carrier protein
MMISTQDVEDRVRDFVATSFLSPEQAEAFDARADLLALLDSLQLLRTVVQLEALFGVKVDDGELTAENLGTVERIASFVGRKRQGGLDSENGACG